MTRKTNARVAGSAFLAYIAIGITAMVLSRTGGATGTAETLASMAEHAFNLRIAAVLWLISTFAAITLGVTLYALTRDVDADLAMLGLTFRVAEGVVGGASLHRSLGLLWLATATGAGAPEPQTAQGMAALLLHEETWGPVIAGSFFAVGSTLFCWLLLRGRLIPTPLAWLGVVASGLVAIVLPGRMLGLVHSPVTELVWAPIAVFEIVFAFLLIFKGLPPVTATAARDAGT